MASRGARGWGGVRTTFHLSLSRGHFHRRPCLRRVRFPTPGSGTSFLRDETSHFVQQCNNDNRTFCLSLSVLISINTQYKADGRRRSHWGVFALCGGTLSMHEFVRFREQVGHIYIYIYFKHRFAGAALNTMIPSPVRSAQVVHVISTQILAPILLRAPLPALDSIGMILKRRSPRIQIIGGDIYFPHWNLCDPASVRCSLYLLANVSRFRGHVDGPSLLCKKEHRNDANTPSPVSGAR